MSKREHQRPHDLNQQVAKSVRPQLPRDGSAGSATLGAGSASQGWLSVCV